MKYFLGLTAVAILSGLTQLNAQTIVWSSFQDSVGTFSSPRSSDLTADGAQDIVLGAGIDSTYSPYGILAFDGVTGSSLWTVPANDEIYGSAVFQDITGDNIPDVFIGGRNAELYAIDGASGAILWQFWTNTSVEPRDSGWYNFSSAQLVADQNSDGFQDLLIANGGDHAAPSWITDRDPGHLMVIDAMTGAVLSSAVMPDSAETYCSPIYFDINGVGAYRVVYGSGGENQGGSMWMTTLADIMANDLSSSVQLATDANKGFIAPASVANFTADVKKDIVIQGYNGKLYLIDGNSYAEIWSYQIPNVESSASPVIGNLTGDATPDVFAVQAKGSAPSFFDFYQILIDGATGAVAKRDSMSDLHFASANAFDYNGDGRDEVLVTMNDFVGSHFVNYLNIIDFQNDSIIELWDPAGGVNLASTPLVNDLDADGLVDITFVMRADSTNPTAVNGVKITRIETNASNPASGIAWGQYMGNSGNGIYFNNAVNCGGINLGFTASSISCNGADDGLITVSAGGGTAPYTYLWSNGEITQSISALAPGTYSVIVTDSVGCFETGSSSVNNPYVLTWGGVSNITCIGDDDGIATVNSSGCPCMFSGCLFDWDNMDSVKTSTHLSGGWNYVVITHTDGCIVEDSIYMAIPAAVIDSFEVENIACPEFATGAINLFPSDPLTAAYSWNNGETSINLTGLASGNYSVSVSDGRPCYDTLNFVVTAADTMFTSIIGSNLSCAGDGSGAATAQTLGGTTNYSYTWNNGGTVSTLTGVNAGTYEVSVTDSLGCINIESVIITEPLMLSVTLAAIDALCYNDNSGSITTSVFGGTTGYSYLWSTGELTENLSNLFSGEYSVTVTDMLGCDKVKSITLSEPAALSMTMSSTSNTLVQCNGTASAFVSGGVSPYSYLWNDGAAQTSNQAIDLCADNFEVDVLDANGCAISDTISIQNDIIDGVFENTPEQGLMIYPNPATSFVVIGFSNNRECTVRLFDVAGKLVYKNERFNNKIRIESLNSGMYFYEVKDNKNESYSGKLLITK